MTCGVECQRPSRGDGDADGCCVRFLITAAGELSAGWCSFVSTRLVPRCSLCSIVQLSACSDRLRRGAWTKARLSGSDERKGGQLVNTGRIKELCCRRGQRTRESRRLTMQSLCVCDESACFGMAGGGAHTHPDDSSSRPAVCARERKGSSTSRRAWDEARQGNHTSTRSRYCASFGA